MRKIAGSKVFEIRRMYAAGQKVSYVCAALGVSVATVRKYVNLAGITRPHGRPPVCHPVTITHDCEPEEIGRTHARVRLCRYCTGLVVSVGVGRSRNTHAECTRAARQVRDRNFYRERVL